MAITYWDSGTASTTTGAVSSWYSSDMGTTTTTNSPIYGYWDPYPRVVHKIVWVTRPKHWDKKVGDAWIRLVNEETRTGWKVMATVYGDVEVIDPYADIRDMKDFVPLLKASAFAEDREKIITFFKRVGLEAKPKAKRAAKEPKKS